MPICTTLVVTLYAEGTVAEVGAAVKFLEAMPTTLKLFFKFKFLITFTGKFIPTT